MTYDDFIALYKLYDARFKQYIDEHKDKLVSEFDAAMKTVVREELSAGSDMALGYYCPSPVQDLIVGNCHRGKILKRITKRSRPDHKYGFNSDGQMVTVTELPYDIERWLVLHEDNKITFICYDCFSSGELFIRHIIQAEYDLMGRIVRYTLGLFGGRDAVIEQEVYTYGDQGISEVLMWDCYSLSKHQLKNLRSLAKESEKYAEWYKDQIRTGNFVRQELYYLQHDKDGFLTGYVAPDSYFSEHVYEITPSRRRKV